jgi:hypothetical protein
MIPWLPGSYVSELDYSPSQTGSTQPALARCQRNFRIAIGAVFLIVILNAKLPAAPHWLHVCLWLAYFVAFASVPITLVRYVATWDELQQRIFVSAAAGAFLITALILMFNVILPKMGFDPLSPIVLGTVPVFAFVICHFVARKRYS